MFILLPREISNYRPTLLQSGGLTNNIDLNWNTIAAHSRRRSDNFMRAHTHYCTLKYVVNIIT